jgi:hypothetical protein
MDRRPTRPEQRSGRPVSAKRSPQTAAKRAREQAVREKRERKAEKKRAATLARKEAEAGMTGMGPQAGPLGT